MNQEDAYPEVNTTPGSMVMVSVNGQQYPRKTVSQCHTCMSPYRLEIERYLIEGHSYQGIATTVGGWPVKPNQRWGHPAAIGIRHHVERKHMPLGPTAERALIEQRSKEIGRSLEDYQSSLVDHVAANQIVIQRGMARLAAGSLEPSMSDLMTAIRNQQAIEQAAEGGVDSATWQEALVAYMEVAQKFIPAEMLNSYGQALSQHPILRAMMMKKTAAIEGEVVSSGEEE
jgi:hypothetical protein